MENDHPAFNLALVINDKIYLNSNFASLINALGQVTSKVYIPLPFFSFLLTIIVLVWSNQIQSIAKQDIYSIIIQSCLIFLIYLIYEIYYTNTMQQP